MRVPAGVIHAPGNRARTAPVEPVWRFCSQFNRTANQILFQGNSAFQTGLAMRHIHRIGSGDVTHLRVLVPNWSVGNADVVATGNAIEVTGCYLEHVGLGVSVQVTFAGAAGVMISNLGSVQSDVITAAAFGLSAFGLDTRLSVRIAYRLPLSGFMPQGTRVDSTDTLCYYYDSTSVAPTNLSGTGALDFGGGHTGFTYCPASILIGKFASGDPRVWLGVGDSILEGAGDEPAGDSGAGFFSRAMQITKSAGLNLGKPSGNVEAWVGGGFTPRPTLFGMMAYANGAVAEYGTNRFDTAPNGTASNRLSAYQLEWGLMHFMRAYLNNAPGARTFKIMRVLLMCRCNQSGYTDTTQVLMGPKWDSGGDVELWNEQMAADVGVFNRAHAVFDPGTVIRRSQTGKGTPGSDWYRWADGMCGDGTHPNTTGHPAIAAAFAPALIALD